MLGASVRIGFVCFLSTMGSVTAASDYPNKPIRIVVGFSPGGTNDIAARVVGQKLSEGFGRPVVIENKLGGGGITATVLVAQASPDGYTLLLCSGGTMSITPHLMDKLPYAVRDFAPISMLITSPYLLLVNAASSLKTTKELIAQAKSRPGQINYGSSGVGATGHLTAELFRSMAQIDITHVPYKGSSQAQADLAGSHVQLVFDTIPAALPMLNSGKLRALGVASMRRSALMPDLPTLSDTGVPGFESASWQGICAPAAVPTQVQQRLGQEIVKALQTAELRDRFAGLGAEIVASTPGEFATYIRSENAKWAKVIREAGVKLK